MRAGEGPGGVLPAPSAPRLAQARGISGGQTRAGETQNLDVWPGATWSCRSPSPALSPAGAQGTGVHGAAKGTFATF